MAVVNNNDRCNSCRFFSAEDRLGLCKRFPSYQNRSNQDWCGEYRLEESDALETMVQFIVEPVVDSEPKKQRGRPKKS